MATKKQASTSQDWRSLQRARRSEWHELEREGEEPLRVRLQRLSVQEAEELPDSVRQSEEEALVTAAGYILEWNLTATNDAGDEAPVPLPSEVDDPVAMLKWFFSWDELSWLYSEIKMGPQLKVLREKKALTQFAATPEASPNGSSPA